MPTEHQIQSVPIAFTLPQTSNQKTIVLEEREIHKHFEWNLEGKNDFYEELQVLAGW